MGGPDDAPKSIPHGGPLKKTPARNARARGMRGRSAAPPGIRCSGRADFDRLQYTLRAATTRSASCSSSISSARASSSSRFGLSTEEVVALALQGRASSGTRGAMMSVRFTAHARAMVFRRFKQSMCHARTRQVQRRSAVRLPLPAVTRAPARAGNVPARRRPRVAACRQRRGRLFQPFDAAAKPMSLRGDTTCDGRTADRRLFCQVRSWPP